jgi:hypothetical protein
VAAALYVPIAKFVLLGIGLWLLASTIAGIGGVAALQEVVPGTLRAVLHFTFCNSRWAGPL